MNHMGKTKWVVGRENFLTMTSGLYVHLFPVLGTPFLQSSLFCNFPTSSDIWAQAGCRSELWHLLLLTLHGAKRLWLILPRTRAFPLLTGSLLLLIFLLLPQRGEGLLPGH